LSSSVMVTFYGIWQNWAFAHNLAHFEAMPGRPNATFTEADWLGVFLILVISITYTLIYYCHSERTPSEHSESRGESRNLSEITSCLMNNSETSNNIRQIPRLRPALSSERDGTSLGMTKHFALYFLLTTFYLLLILTVSRSAWLGALVATIIFFWMIFTDLKFNPKQWHWKETIYLKLKFGLSIAIAIIIVYLLNLTDFQLGNRIQSTGTGLQKITISCPPYDWVCKIPDVIEDTKELEKCECRQINLEEIETAGGIISEVYRKDPNIKIRNEIYQKSWEEIKNHPLVGVGWGNINKILGTDERGTPLNSSNIFLETWLGSGIIGFLSLGAILGYILFNAIKNYFFASDASQKIFNLFVVISWLSIVIFNFFNAGIFLGFLWVWLGITQSNTG
jgi:hypothetical protein